MPANYLATELTNEQDNGIARKLVNGIANESASELASVLVHVLSS